MLSPFPGKGRNNKYGGRVAPSIQRARSSLRAPWMALPARKMEFMNSQFNEVKQLYYHVNIWAMDKLLLTGRALG